MKRDYYGNTDNGNVRTAFIDKSEIGVLLTKLDAQQTLAAQELFDSIVGGMSSLDADSCEILVDENQESMLADLLCGSSESERQFSRHYLQVGGLIEEFGDFERFEE